MLLTFGLLGMAVVALWLPGKPYTWIGFLLMSGLAALFHGYIGVPAVFALGLVAFFARASSESEPFPKIGKWQPLAPIGLTLLMIAAMIHVLPGFNNPVVLHEVYISADGIPYTKYLNFDKTAVGILVLGLAHPLVGTKSAWTDLLKWVLRLTPVVVLLLLPVSFALGYVVFDPKWSRHLPLWAATNLLFTCLAEEALFRGILQRGFQRKLGTDRRGLVLSVIGAAVLFGIIHYAGGWKYMLLSTLAGICYGTVYAVSGRIEASMLVHFFTNLCHFLLFTYPALASAFA